MHKVLVPIAGGGASALLLVQAEGGDLDEVADIVKPVVDSFIWTDT